MIHFRTKKLKGLEGIKISPIEKILVNWATPFDYVYIVNKVSFCEESHVITFRKKYFEEDHYFKKGTWRGLVDSKIDDYKRLIKNKLNGEDERVDSLYGETTCGKAMISTYNIFHKKLIL